MVTDGFSSFILVHWTRLTMKYAKHMVPGSFSRFIFVNWTRLTLKYYN